MKYYSMFVILMMGFVLFAGCTSAPEIVKTTVIVDHKDPNYVNVTNLHKYNFFDEKGNMYTTSDEKLYNEIQVGKTYTVEFDMTTKMIISVKEISK